MGNSVLTLTLDQEGLDKLHHLYDEVSLEPPTPYILFFAKDEGVSICLYKDGKLVLQGADCERVASYFGYEPEVKEEKKRPFPQYGQIGSDEVGTGDIFGPIIVVGAYVKPSQLKLLRELGITDSKLLSDEKILALGPRLINEFDYSSLTLDNEKYNEVHKTNNLNAIKAKMHNSVLSNLKRRHYGAEITIDQFCAPSSYFKYLSDTEEVVEEIVFSTKGELAFPAVALASVIARYSFLRHMQELSKELGEEIPLGAGNKVKEFAEKMIKEKGREALNKFAKTDYKTIKEL